MYRFLSAVIAITLLPLAGCEKKPSDSGSGTQPPPPAAPKPDSPPAHDDAAGDAKGPGHGGAVVELGSTTVNGQTVKASRDAGEIKAGGDSPIDIWIDGGLGGATAVRFWIGTEDAKGSIKAKADIEANHWHTHTEVPDPLPAGSKLWVEIEGKDAKKSTVAFDLKT